MKMMVSGYVLAQANGLVERLHGTLVPMVHKYSSNSRDWCAVIPLVLYFICMTLLIATSTGFSPYIIVYGWESASLVEVLYDAWVDVHSYLCTLFCSYCILLFLLFLFWHIIICIISIV